MEAYLLATDLMKIANDIRCTQAVQDADPVKYLYLRTNPEVLYRARQGNPTQCESMTGQCTGYGK